MLGGAVLGALSQHCPHVERALSGRGLLDKLRAHQWDVLVIDLEAEDIDFAGIGDIIRGSGRPITVGYAPHVATQRLDNARAAGFAAVITRGQASSQLSAILSQLLSAP